MKKVLLIVVAAFLVFFIAKRCTTDGGSDTTISGYEGEVSAVEGRTLTLVSGLKVRLLGVEDGRTDVEMFVRAMFLNKRVILYADSHSNKQYIESPDDVVDAYVVVKDTRDYCVNRQVVNEYPDSYREIETLDSVGWIGQDPLPAPKKNLALYMKQRTFLIDTGTGIGTGFFISEDGLAVTNWHVLAPGEERNAVAVLFQDDPDDSQVYSDKKRNFKNILWSSDMKGLDITLVTVDLENNERVPYFNIAKRRPNQGDKVATYGNPKGLTASYTSGEISAFRADPFTPGRDVQLVQYQMPTNGGNSGGPVCDIYGQVVAVHELGDKSSQNINYGIDVMQLRPVLDKMGLKYGGR